MSLVKLSNVVVRYGKLVAVKGISFEIPEGEVFGFIGPNGAGKSSTIKLLATLLRPSRGKAVVAGHDVVARPKEVRRIIGYVPDTFGVYEDLTTREYLHFFAAAHGIARRERKALVDNVLALTDLTGKIDSQVDGLSRGMKQRLSIARVLLHDPQVLLLDEPAAGLDPRARIEMRELLKELQRMGKTVLISSHILHELSQLCTCIGIIEAGEMIAEGSLDEIYRQIDLKRMVHVQLANRSPELIEKIHRLPGVRHVDEQVDRLVIQLQEREAAVEELHDRLVEVGARLRMFQPEAMDMETAFMKLTHNKTA